MKGRVAILLAVTLALVHSIPVEKLEKEDAAQKQDAVQDPLIVELDKQIEEIKATSEKAKADIDIAANEAKAKLSKTKENKKESNSKKDLMLNAAQVTAQGADWADDANSPVGIECESAAHEETCSERSHCDWIPAESLEVPGYCTFGCTFITSESICTNHSAMNCSFGFDYAATSAKDTCAGACTYTAGVAGDNSDATCSYDGDACEWDTESDACVLSAETLMRRSHVSLLEAKKIQLTQIKKKGEKDKEVEEKKMKAEAEKLAAKKERADEIAAKKEQKKKAVEKATAEKLAAKKERDEKRAAMKEQKKAEKAENLAAKVAAAKNTNKNKKK